MAIINNFVLVQNSMGAWTSCQDKVILDAIDLHRNPEALILTKKMTVAGVEDCVVFSICTQGKNATFFSYIKIGNNTISIGNHFRGSGNDEQWHNLVAQANEKLFS